MSVLDTIRVEKDGIGHILQDKRLVVPPYQRPFAWNEREVEDLYNDIARAVQADEPHYFLGSIVITNREGVSGEVVDGQQRLATSAILLAAIRDYFHHNDDSGRADSMEKFLFDRDLRTQELQPNIRLSEMDDDFFRKRVLCRPDSSDRGVQPQRPSHKRIEKAAQIAATRVRDLVKAMADPANGLSDWVEYLCGRAVVVVVTASSEANAFVIFETLNDRGLDLAVSDLLKNLLFREAKDRIEEVRQRWTTMSGVLEGVAGEANLVTFIRHMWSSRHGLTREKQLYDKIAESMKTKQHAVNLATDLVNDAGAYSALLNADHERWSEFSPTAAQDVRTLNMLGMVQMRPLLLAILTNLENKDVPSALRFVVCSCVRFPVTGKLGSGPLEELYCSEAKKLREGGLKSTSDLKDSMTPRVPDDAEFEEAFRTAQVNKAALARYYLTCLENEVRGGQAQPLVPTSDTGVVNLEHVLPEHPSSAWGQYDAETVATLYRRLGNLALIETRVNASIGNEGFDKKRPSLEAADFELTKEIAQRSQWGRAEIEERQARLALLAVKAWPRKG